MINHNVRDAIASLRDNPSDLAPYRIGGKCYKIKHKNRPLEIWVANGIPGMALESRGVEFWGGVTFRSVFMLSFSHIALWWAARKWLRKDMPPEYRTPSVADILK